MHNNLFLNDLRHFTNSPKSKTFSRKLNRILNHPGMMIVLLNRFLNEYKNLLFFPFNWLLRKYYYHLAVKYGIMLPLETNFGENLRIYHFGGIIIHPKAILGNNVTVAQGVTIGCNLKDRNSPVIGDNVQLGAGAKIIGNIKIGNNCKIGPNVFINFNVEENKLLIIDKQSYLIKDIL